MSENVSSLFSFIEWEKTCSFRVWERWTLGFLLNGRDWDILELIYYTNIFTVRNRFSIYQHSVLTFLHVRRNILVHMDMAQTSQFDSHWLMILYNSLFLSFGCSCNLLLTNHIRQKGRDITALIMLCYMAKVIVLTLYMCICVCVCLYMSISTRDSLLLALKKQTVIQ